jgi:hypothetical protein
MTMFPNRALANKTSLEATNYIRSPYPSITYSNVRFTVGKVKAYRERCGDAFNLILVGDRRSADDFYVLPYELIRDLLVEDTITNEKSGQRSWFITVKDEGLVRVKHRSKRLKVARGAGLPMK